MIWIIGYLIGIILCVIVLYLTGFNCNNGNAVFLLSTGWPILLIGFLIYAIVVFFIDVHFYFKDKNKDKK
jgi:thiosulfate reductase cytochrome b subunit